MKPSPTKKTSNRLLSLLSRKRARKRQDRTCRFEQLEARRVLTAAVWNNAVSPLNVNGDAEGFVVPSDVLVLVNELNGPRYSDPQTGRLPKQIDGDGRPPYLDVNCDGFATASDALVVINHINSGADPQPGGLESSGGSWANASCSPQLIEGSGFATELTRRLTLPDDTSAVKVLFHAPEFDSTGDGVRDAFEIEVTDTTGNPVAFAYQPGRDASYNWTEGEGVVFGPGVQTTTAPAGEDSSATIYLAGTEAGTEVIVRTRLVNNDGDDTSSVIVRGFEVIDSDVVPPAGQSGFAAQSVGIAPVPWQELSDLSSSLVPSYGRTSLSGDNTDLITELAVTNQGRQAVMGRVIVVVENMSDLDATPLNPDGFTADGNPFFDLSRQMDGQPLEPGTTIRSREIRFRNNTGERFSYNLRTLGDVNQAPGSFGTTPGSSIEAGRTYRYTAAASDPEGQPLVYNLVSGPEGASIDSVTGELSWSTTAENVGQHRMIVRASDPHGLYVEQPFSVTVKEVQQNRPPVFTTDPVTEAVASSGFEVTTVGVGSSPAGAAVISGFRGPRIVTANTADQTIGVYAGENNDRFDEAEEFSTGHPQRNGQWVDSGTTVGFGAPEARQAANYFYDISTYDHGDFNGDGYLDMVVGHHFDRINDNSIGTFKLTVVLNDGNGMFGAPIDLYENEIYSYQTYVRTILVEDVNADGNDDILFAEYHNGGTLFVSLGNGDGTFEPIMQSSYEDAIIGDFVVEDIDGDGALDLFGRTFETRGNNRHLFWSRGVGDGTFEAPNVFRETRVSGFRETSAPYSLSDLDGDGDVDFVISGDYPLIQVFHNDGSGNFTLANDITPPNGYAFYGADWVKVGDFTGDGHQDILLHHVWRGNLDLLVGDGSGVDFTYQEGTSVRLRPDNWAMGFEPMDVDQDGDLDLVFGTEQGKQGVSVGLNDGTGHFLLREYAITEVSTGLKIAYTDATVRGALFGDYNSDGVIDVSYFTTDNNFNGQTDQHAVGILLGTRPGEFGRTRTEPWLTPSWTDAAHIGDFNGDGVFDILDTASDVTALGNGNGTFGDLIPASGVRRPGHVAAVADYNNDGLDDVVSNLEGGLYVGLSNGDGTFTVNQNISGGGFYGYNTIDPVDLNLDGYMDFVVKEEVGRYFEAHLNDPLNPGTFTLSFSYSLGEGAQGVNVSNWEESWDVGDFTGDGIPDLLTADREGYSGPQVRVVVLAGDGDGGFTPYSEVAAFQEERMGGIYGLAVEPGDFATGDIDNDGDLDLVAHSYLGARVLLNDGEGNFTISNWLEPVRTQQRGRESWLVDFNQDGNLDFVVAVAADINGSFLFWEGDGAGNFEVVDGVNMHAIPLGIRDPFIDWDNDGHLDLIYNTQGTSSDEIALYMGRRDDLVDMIAVDLNGDGNEEVIALQEQMERLQIFAGDNLGGLTRQSDLQAGLAPQAVASTDLDGDGQMELLVANRVGRNVSVYSGKLTDGYTHVDFPVGSAESLATRPIDIGAVDVTGDGNPEVFVLDEGNQALWIYEGNGTMALDTPTAILLGDRPGRFVIEDADGDNQLDAIVTLPDSNRLMILSGVGSDPGTAPVYVSLSASPSDVAVLDLNDDGYPEIAATQASANALSVHYGLGNNQFARAQQIAVGQSPSRVVGADADEDGRMDLVVTNSGDDTVSVIYNRFDPNEVYRYDADAIDPDDDALTYAIVDGPGGLIINSDSGAILWAASPDQVGIHDVTISADDGRGGVATQSFKIEVEPARENTAPIIATNPIAQIGANEDFAYVARALDAEDHPLRFTLLDGPKDSSIDPTTGELHWDGRTQAEDFNRFGTTGTISVPYSDSLKPSSTTIETWVQLTFLSRFNMILQDQGIQVTTHETNQSIRVDISLPGENLRFFVPITPEADRWYHVAVTYAEETGRAELHLDGQLVGFTTASTPQPLNTTPGITQVGSAGNTRARYDQYRVWNYARSQSEIREGMSREYQDDPRLILDFRFEDGQNNRSVEDHSIYGNAGFRVRNGGESQIIEGLTETGSYDFTILVEDGRGGSDVQSFTLEVLPELRGRIIGHLFDDVNGDGDQDDGSEEGVEAEPNLEGWHLWIDANGNGFPDPHEYQAITNLNGKYSFDGLLPGDYPVSVSAVAGYETPTEFTATVQPEIVRETNPDAVPSYDLAIAQLALSQIRGQLKSEDGEAIAYWKTYADLNNNGQRDDGEPMATSDRSGNFAVAGLSAGTYTIRTDLPAGWADSAGRDGLTVALANDEVSEQNDFTLRPTNTSVTGGVHFVTMPSGDVEARQTFTYASIAMGIRDPSIVYDLSLAPDGMVIDPATGLVAWKPSIAQVGEHLVVLRATAEDGSIALHDFYANVAGPNSAPVLSRTVLESSGQLPTAYVDFTYAIDLAAQDAEQPSVEFSLVSGPAGATLDPDTGALRWTPTSSDTGEHDFIVELSDSEGAVSKIDFAVVVVNDQPALTPFDIAPVRNQVGLGQDYLTQLSGTDALGRPLTWSLDSAPDGVTLDASNTLRWTPSSDQLGQHTVELTASTFEGTSEQHSVAVEVLGRAVNRPPMIHSEPLYSATVDRAFEYDIEADDADLDILAYALLDSPAGMSIHPDHGTLRWTPADDQRGEHSVQVQVTDPDGTTDTQSFEVTVSRFGGPPRITSIAPVEAAVGQGYLYSVEAVDSEGDPLTYSLLTAPEGMTIAEETGEVSWTPGATQLGEQDVVIQVSDGVGGTTTQAFRIAVAEGLANLPPTITTTAPRFAAVGSTYSYRVAAIDPENTTVGYTLAAGPDGMTVEPESGNVAWTPSAEQVGQHVVTLLATDAGGASAVESFLIDVLAENSIPAILATPPSEATAGARFVFDIQARDADLDPLTFELTTAPEGASIDPFGALHWTPSDEQIGDHDFEVRVSDPRGGEARQSFEIEVVADTQPPKVSLIETPNDASRNILPWQGPFRVFARAIDNVEVASLTLTANGQDIPLDASGSATFEFEDWFFNTITATATATDINGNTASRTISFNYDVPEGWSSNPGPEVPTAIITSPADNGTAVGMVSITGTADHENFGAYTLSYRHVDETSFTEFHRSTTPVVDGELGVWDTSLLLNDEYVIRLQVATTEGTANVVEHSVGLAGELKLGNFQLSFTDMVIPVAGIPIEITRIYDTLQADRQGDFGYGWRLEYRNTDLRVGLPKSGLEDIGIYTPLRPGVKVFLNVPGEGRQGFTFNPDIRVLPGWGGNNLVLARPRFTPDPGVTSTLGTGTSSYLQVNDRGELYAPGGIPYNPASPDFGGAYVLTTREGLTYRINGSSGKLDSAIDLAGNAVHFRSNGIYAGVSEVMGIRRDASNRIKSITLPNGATLDYRYSGSGDLIESKDPEGNSTSYSYAEAQEHYLESVFDALGRTATKAEYNAEGRLVKVISGENGELQVSYDPENSLIVETNAIGGTFVTEFDAAGFIVAETDESGATTRYDLDSRGNAIRTTDSLGRVERREFNRYGEVTSFTDALGNETLREFSQFGEVTLMVLPDGSALETEFDDEGRILKQIDPEGGVAEFDYSNLRTNLSSFGGANIGFEPGELIQSIEVPGVGATELEFDANRLVTSIVSPSPAGTNSQVQYAEVVRNLLGQPISVVINGKTTNYAYDAAGFLSASSDSFGNETRYRTDGDGNRSEVIFADGSSEKRRYDPLGRLTEEINASGHATRFIYDAVGRVVETIFPDATPEDDLDNPRTKSEYDSAGQLVAITDERGHATRLQYDLNGQLIRRIDAKGNQWSYRYDSRGNLVSEMSPAGVRTDYEFDGRNRIVGMTHADGAEYRFEYDGNDEFTKTIDALGNETIFERDELGALVSVTDPIGRKTRYEYNSHGDIALVEDALGRRTTFVYNDLGHLIEKSLPDASVETFTYDLEGNIVERIDALGIRSTHQYDLLGRLSAIVFDDGTSYTYQYTPTGKYSSIQRDGETVSYEYDARDRLVRRTDWDGIDVNYRYDASGNILEISSSVSSLQYTYDVVGNPQSVLVDGDLWQFEYDSDRRLLSIMHPNGLDEVYAYDSRSNVVEHLLNGPDTGAIFAYRFEYDLNARLTGKSGQSGHEELFHYDAAGQLVGHHVYDGATSVLVEYTYDRAGNRTAKRDSIAGEEVYTHNVRDQLTRVTRNGETVGEYSYDARGNLIREDLPSGDFKQYTFNAANQLTRVFGTSVDVEYKYSPDGTLSERVENGFSTRLVVDSNREFSQLLAEIVDGSDAKSHVAIPDTQHKIGEQNLQTGQSFSLHSDRNYSVVAVSHSNGEIAELVDYGAFGESTREPDSTTHAFHGEFRDHSTGLDYLRARFYMPETGRFISDDPFPGIAEVPELWNQYTFGLNDPINNRDPSGLSPLTEQQIKIAILSTTTLLGAGYGYLKAKETGGNVYAYTALYALAGLAIGLGAIYAGPALSQTTTIRTTVGQTQHHLKRIAINNIEAKISRNVTTTVVTTLIPANVIQVSATATAYTAAGVFLDLFVWGFSSLGDYVRDAGESRAD